MSLPVRIFGLGANGKPFNLVGETVDVSTAGVCVRCDTSGLAAGDTVGIEQGTNKARYRVQWVGKLGTARYGQFGAVSLAPEKNIWPVSLPREDSDAYSPFGGGPADPIVYSGRVERRRYPRHACALAARLRLHPAEAPIEMVCSDISRGGCYMQTLCPPPVGTEVSLALDLGNGNELHTLAVVRTCHPGCGVGVQFVKVMEPQLLDAYCRGYEDPQQAVRAERLKEFCTRLERCTAELKHLEELLLHAEADGGLLRGYREALQALERAGAVARKSSGAEQQEAGIDFAITR